MKIALFTETYLPQINGVVTHVKLLKEGLEKLGHSVLVVTADYKTHRHYVKDNILHCPATQVKKFYGFGVASPVSRKRVKLLQDFNPDIIHIHNEFGVGLSGVAIARQLRVPLVYTLHTMYDEYLYYIAPRRLINMTRKVSHRYTRFLASRADALTGPSKKCEEYFRKAGIKKSVNVIPNAVELDMFSPDNINEEKKKAFRLKYNIADDQMIACFVGRLGKEKSVDILLNYWAETITPEDKIHLLVIGDGPCRPELEQQANSLGIGSMVTFTGAVLHDELPPYYASCDIYITASLSDTNSISMLEGMATGLPVLQRFDDLNKDQVCEGVNGYVFVNAAEMAQKLREVKHKTPQELEIFKKSVIESVKKSGAINLANYMLAVYHNIYNQSDPNEFDD